MSVPGSFLESAEEQARQVVERFVKHYNETRLHSAIGYVTPTDMLLGREREIWEARDRKLEAAREKRRCRRQALHQKTSAPGPRA